MTGEWSTLRLTVLLSILIALTFGLTGNAVAQRDSQEQTETPQAAPPGPLRIPPADRARRNPVPHVPEAIESGRCLFSSQCVMCHGARGDGRGDLARTLHFNMPDLTDPGLQKKRTDGDLFYLICHDHGQMPGENRLCSQNRWEIVHYIRTLKRIVARR